MININIKKIHPDAIIPQYQTAGSAGFDLHAISEILIPKQSTVLVPTGLCFEIPVGYELQIRPRSGMSLKTNLRIANSPGTIDSDYRGEVCIICTNTADNGSHHIKKHERIAQAVLAKVEQAVFITVDELTETTRGEGGFGHTDKNKQS